jgi:hypothetical protein
MCRERSRGTAVTSTTGHTDPHVTEEATVAPDAGAPDDPPRDPAEEAAVEEQERSQEELNRTSRATGGDAPAAASVDEREAVAADEDELFDDDAD